MADVERRPEKEAIPGVLIIRVDAPLTFGNTEMIKAIITDLITQQKEPVHLVAKVVLNCELTTQALLPACSAVGLPRMVGVALSAI
ncbi:MAG: STAS domain-containing protein [Euryarchaeota archaeon]|nr:STAS domain-containing protein [Euryarchaeota archaeon]